jgi:hypothetical protein
LSGRLPSRPLRHLRQRVRRWDGGQLRAVALLGPQGATRRGRWPLPLSDHSKGMSLETLHQVSRASDSHSPGGAGRGVPKGFKAAGPAGAPGSSRGAGGPAAWGVSRFCRAWPPCRTTASSCPTILGHTRCLGSSAQLSFISMSIPEVWMSSWIRRERARSPRERVG